MCRICESLIDYVLHAGATFKDGAWYEGDGSGEKLRDVEKASFLCKLCCPTLAVLQASSPDDVCPAILAATVLSFVYTLLCWDGGYGGKGGGNTDSGAKKMER